MEDLDAPTAEELAEAHHAARHALAGERASSPRTPEDSGAGDCTSSGA